MAAAKLARRARPAKKVRTRLSPDLRRSQILDAAAQVAIGDGPSAVSLERLAKELGISKALAYSYFRSRDELLAALLHREQLDLRDRGMRAALEAKSFDELIRRTTRLYLEQSRDRGALIEALLADPSVARLMAPANRVERDRTVRFFVRAARRRYRLDLATAIAVVRLLMPVTGEAGKAVSEGALDIDEAERLCVDLITGGMERLSARRRRTPRGR